MRMLLKAHIDLEAGNDGIRSGRTGKNLQTVIQHLQPEAAYFIVEDGMRTLLAIFDVKTTADLPELTEPFFNMHASVELTPAMSVADMGAAFQPVPGVAAAGGTPSSRVAIALAKFDLK